MNGLRSSCAPWYENKGSEERFGGALAIPRRRQPLPNGRAKHGFGLLEGYPDVLNIGHICEITGLSAQTVRQECSRGNLPAVRIGRRWFVTKPMFIDYLVGRGACAQQTR